MTKRTTLFWPFVLAAPLTLAVSTRAAPAAAPLTPPAVLGAAKTIQFTATDSVNGIPEQSATAALAWPNKAIILETNLKAKAVDTAFASDGKTQIEWQQSRNYYIKSDSVKLLSDMKADSFVLFALEEFLTPKAFAEYHHAAADPAGVYRKTLRRGESSLVTTDVLTVSPNTGLPESWSTLTTSSKTPGTPVERIVFTGWKLNAPVDDAKFAYTPPASATRYTPPKLLADGTPAPDFTANDKDGHPVKLSDYKGKVVVLDFWATWCGPCQKSLPHTTKVAKEDADKGVVVLAVNVWDKPDAFQAWLPKHPEYAPLQFAIDPSTDNAKGIATGLYGVSGIPTQYIIGKDGSIVKSIVGYDEGSTDLEDALKTAGVK